MSLESELGRKFLLSLGLALGLLCYGGLGSVTLGSVTLGSVTLAQAEVWQDAVDDTRLTSVSNSSGAPSLGVDSNGNIHIAWEDNRNNNYEIYYTKLYNNGTTVVDDTRLTSDSATSQYHSLGVDNANNIHITWEDNRNGFLNSEIYYTKLDGNGGTLVNDTRLTSTASGSSGSPSLGVDNANNIHIAWHDSRIGGFPLNSEIYYTKLDNNGNTSVADTRLTSDSGSSMYPSLGVDSSGNIHVAWSDNRDGNYEIYYTKLDSNGNTVVDDTRLTSNSSSSMYPSLGMDSSNNIHITWYDNRDSNYEIYYTKLDGNGGTLVNDTRLTSNSSSSMYPSLGVDSSNNIHITWYDNRDSNYEIYYTKLDSNGNTVVDDTRLTSNSSSSMYPSLGVDSSNNIHIAWSDDRDGNYEIYYTKGTTVTPSGNSGDGGGGGCFIATAAYGTPLAEEVQILSRFRDTYLLPNSPGQKLVSLYYRLSPPLARYIKDNAYLKIAVRGMLKPIVWLVQNFFVEDSKGEESAPIVQPSP